MALKTRNLGFPRIGAKRELKKAVEAFWAGKSSFEELTKVGVELRRKHWEIQKKAGIHHIPSNDFSFYDQMLDMAITLGAIPARYRKIQDPFKQYFAMARGLQEKESQIDVSAMEMTKWFDTNYHYIVPELTKSQAFSLNAAKILSEIEEARKYGIETCPVIIGPVTFLLLSKRVDATDSQETPLQLLETLLPLYQDLLGKLRENKVEWVQIDEPGMVLDSSDETRKAYYKAFAALSSASLRPKILVATYFHDLGENLPLVSQLGCEALHIDLVRAPEQLDTVLKTLPPRTALSLGVVDGRNIWRTDLDAASQTIQRAVKSLGEDRVYVTPSCSLLHTPVDLALEKKLEPELKNWLSFSVQKLTEIKALAEGLNSAVKNIFEESRAALEKRARSNQTKNPVVRERLRGVSQEMLHRRSSYAQRAAKQRHALKLPLFPTTTIGSFPQTLEVREARAGWRSGRLSEKEYELFLREETKRCVEKQESMGIDVLVHGEFERTDMVEYFGEQLDGFTFTSNGWVQSYGSRCVKPPLIFGDVNRPLPMTVQWATYAQSLSRLPVKGMLTGPVTILQWSFVRNDQPRSETCKQIGLALRDEVMDLEKAGIAVIQVDEPALREGLPLRENEHQAYLRWAVDSFRLATCGVKDETQIHTHMCYAEFGDILDAVVEMDADVISLETSRSHMELLGDFEKFHYPNEVGPGVYDIHSKRVPSTEEIVDLVKRAIQVIPPDRLWINPDCGLKTRGWPEVEDSLKHMMEAVHLLRGECTQLQQP